MLSGLATFLSYHLIRESLNPKQWPAVIGGEKKKKGKHASSRRGMVFVQKPFSKPSRDITSILKCLTPTRSTPLVSEAEERRNILNPLALLKAKLLFKSPLVDIGKGAITDFISCEAWFLKTLVHRDAVDSGSQLLQALFICYFTTWGCCGTIKCVKSVALCAIQKRPRSPGYWQLFISHISNEIKQIIFLLIFCSAHRHKMLLEIVLSSG